MPAGELTRVVPERTRLPTGAFGTRKENGDGRLQRIWRPARGNPVQLSERGRRTPAEWMRENKESGAIPGGLDSAGGRPSGGRLGPGSGGLIEFHQDPQTEKCRHR